MSFTKDITEPTRNWYYLFLKCLIKVISQKRLVDTQCNIHGDAYDPINPCHSDKLNFFLKSLVKSFGLGVFSEERYLTMNLISLINIELWGLSIPL